MLAALSSLQFPLAYLAGKSWSGREAGLLWASLLLFPSWSGFEQVFPEHTQLTAAATLATLCCLVRFVQGGKRKYLFLGALSFTLALHAHPSAVILVFPLLATIIVGWRRKRLGPADIFAAALVASIPFVPLLIDQLLNGFSILHSIGDYSQSDQSSLIFGNIPALIWEIAVGGLRYWLTFMLNASMQTSWIVTILFVILLLGGVLGLALRVRNGDSLSAFTLLALAVCLLLLVAIRNVDPYYMTTAYRTGLLGAVSVGLVTILSSLRWRRWLICSSVLLGISAQAWIWTALDQWDRNGAFPLAFVPLFDVKGEWQPSHRFAFIEARSMAASGDWLCKQDKLSVHGDYGLHLIWNYAVDMRRVCPGSRILVGGSDAEHNHWIGLPRHMVRSLSVTSGENIGGFELLPVRRVLSRSAGVVDAASGGYPPIDAPTGPDVSWQIVATLAEGERIAITNLAFISAVNARVRVWAGSRELQPIAESYATQVYSCAACGRAPWRIELSSNSPDYVDVVSF